MKGKRNKRQRGGGKWMDGVKKFVAGDGSDGLFRKEDCI